MPTAAKLFAAFGFVVVVFFATEIFKTYLPEGSQVENLTPINCLVAFICGWMITGRLAGKGYYRATGSGVRTTGVAVFYMLLIWSVIEMIKRSTRMYYEGPSDALIAMTDLIAEYFLLMISDPQVPIVLLGGGILAACLSEWANERWS